METPSSVLSEEGNKIVMTVPEILAATGMTQKQLSESFSIPLRTVVNWCCKGSNHRECPTYVLLMMQEILGLSD